MKIIRTILWLNIIALVVLTLINIGAFQSWQKDTAPDVVNQVKKWVYVE